MVQLGRTHGDAALRVAIEDALTLGCHDVAAVRHLLSTDALDLARGPHGRPAPLPPLVVGPLADYDRPLPTVTAYDRLLERQPVGAAVRAGVVR